jgi:hypothetical protein
MLRDGAGLSIERLEGVAEPTALRVKLEVDDKKIRLVEPKEPLGWAVGTEKAGVFRCAWHSERMPGTRPVPAAREAGVDAARHTAVRVWGDDGSVTTQLVKEVGA